LRPSPAGCSSAPRPRRRARELWYERNSIYKAAGYCFRTPRAISAFGNAGCVYDSEYDVPLSPRQRRRVQSIRALERDLGCRG
jgi:hypothetical protein